MEIGIVNKSKLPEYDFLGSVYQKTKPDQLAEAFESIQRQSLKPKNIFLVVDGPIEKEVKNIIKAYKKIIPIKVIKSKKNQGHGLSLRKGLYECESEIVLRFDHDDIIFKDSAFFIVKELSSGNTDIVGSNVYEFDNQSSEFISLKIMPLTHNSISRAIFLRNPINHPSVGFLRKSIINLKEGGYRKRPFYEDYDLWIRALSSGLIFKNLDTPLVAMRITNQIDRRRGLNKIRGELGLLITFLEQNKFKGFLFLPSLIIRIFFALLPLKAVSFLYKNFFRKKMIY